MTDPIFESMDPLGRCDLCDEKCLTHELTVFSGFEIRETSSIDVCRACLARLVRQERAEEATMLRVIARRVNNRFRRKAA